ncbi:MAG: HypC/HybG/HupF family hydrogenase formation chaperone [Dysgonamonadaceae bacterium]|jgi:hydrogenase expression/formation protein HypC|nr:HypC/HybG/HupF family hydrogenase formation chaperone [Dysgonamonadaceae bacterium]
MCLAIPGKLEKIVAELDETFRTGSVSFEGIVKNVNLSLVPEAKIGDYVLVHVGTAISVIDQREAERTMNTLKMMGEGLDLTPQSL